MTPPTQNQANRMMRSARRMTAAWNHQKPDQETAWEIVEEAMAAYIRAQVRFHRQGPAAVQRLLLCCPGSRGERRLRGALAPYAVL